MEENQQQSPEQTPQESFKPVFVDYTATSNYGSFYLSEKRADELGKAASMFLKAYWEKPGYTSQRLTKDMVALAQNRQEEAFLLQVSGYKIQEMKTEARSEGGKAMGLEDLPNGLKELLLKRLREKLKGNDPEDEG